MGEQNPKDKRCINAINWSYILPVLDHDLLQRQKRLFSHLLVFTVSRFLHYRVLYVQTLNYLLPIRIKPAELSQVVTCDCHVQPSLAVQKPSQFPIISFISTLSYGSHSSQMTACFMTKIFMCALMTIPKLQRSPTCSTCRMNSKPLCCSTELSQLILYLRSVAGLLCYPSAMCQLFSTVCCRSSAQVTHCSLECSWKS